ncbi:ACP S-malonyltransferase [Kitasatospora sp. NPDC088346]|uniref:ACP S-malonyltransferase n=1 Tax=Kitasatospora sp. NPDC088346 TaxID=3364073 RepID=UPI0038271C91
MPSETPHRSGRADAVAWTPSEPPVPSGLGAPSETLSPVALLTRILALPGTSPAAPRRDPAADPPPGRPALALVFPGQGAQRPGMGAPWRDTAAWQTVQRLSESCGQDLADLLLDADADRLRRPDNAQLATLTLEMVMLRALRESAPGRRFAACAGHSLGEYAALVAAGVLTPEDAVRVVAERGAAMAEAADRVPGAMAALIGPGAAATAERLTADLRATAAAQVWVANYNAPGQVVVSGTPAAVAALAERAAEAGLRTAELAVAGAFHTPLMAPARPRLAAALARVPTRPAHCPVVANVDGRAHLHHPERWRARALRQLTSPVRWEGSQRTLARLLRGRAHPVELGPGRVLAGLWTRTVPDQPARSAATPEQLHALTAARLP